MSDPAICHEPDRCITCGDVAEAVTVIAVDDDRGLALCEDDGGSRSTVEIALIAPVTAGDPILVHAGTAIQHLGEVRA